MPVFTFRGKSREGKGFSAEKKRSAHGALALITETPVTICIVLGYPETLNLIWVGCGLLCLKRRLTFFARSALLFFFCVIVKVFLGGGRGKWRRETGVVAVMNVPDSELATEGPRRPRLLFFFFTAPRPPLLRLLHKPRSPISLLFLFLGLLLQRLGASGTRPPINPPNPRAPSLFTIH
jgi:hypothetical protein